MSDVSPSGDDDHLHCVDEDTWLLGKIPSSSSSLASSVDASNLNAVVPVAKSFSHADGDCERKIVRKKCRSRTREKLGKLLRAVYWLKQSNRQLHKQVLELKQLVLTKREEGQSPSTSCPLSFSKPLVEVMSTERDFEQFEAAVLDADYRRQVTSYLCALRGDRIRTFAQRIFGSLFSDDITRCLTFFGARQNKRAFFGSTTYGIVLDVFKKWNADKRSDLFHLEEAFRYTFKKARDRLCKRSFRRPADADSNDQLN
ncbi:unnamed protein product [Dibothriocephalus latus]|uniref:DUF4806 domain-containing protein n=1 Tax=Dibothriocephalus latus TaxID=60516 RepID=A0A3P7R7I1_DIBLA|nr:unnamed protein product [Dibothriocephalus latus]